jgi:uncharacterized protein YbjT (DUF2867 family)
MAVLVIGTTGHVGVNVVHELSRRGAEVVALVHKHKPDFPDEVRTVRGDVTDMESMRKAFQGINTVFLLNPVVPDELNRAILCLNLAMEARIERIVCFRCSTLTSSWIARTHPRNMRPS